MKILKWILCVIVIIIMLLWFLNGTIVHFHPTKATVETFLKEYGCNPYTIKTDMDSEYQCIHYLRRHTKNRFGKLYPSDYSISAYANNPFGSFFTLDDHMYTTVITKDEGPLVFNPINGNFIGTYNELMLKMGCEVKPKGFSLLSASENTELMFENSKCRSTKLFEINETTPKLTTLNVAIPNLKITNLDCYTDVVNYTHVKAKITNKGTISADYVVMPVDFFNGDKFVDTIKALPDDTTKGIHILPGDSYSFSNLKEDLPLWTRCEARTQYNNKTVQATRREMSNIKITNIKVIDGDTIQLSTGENVRLIGINAPEQGEKCYEEAKEFLEGVVIDKEITLQKDVEDKDQYGRLLRYVYADGYDISWGMLALGYAHKYEYGLNTRESSSYESAEAIGKKECGCIWQPCSNINENIIDYIKDNCFSVTNFHFNAVGDDNYNLNDEYVTIKNNCNYNINMEGWTIKDNTASHVYSFPSFSITGLNSFTLYTGAGTNTNSALYWGRTSGNYAAIWNNNGDTLYLRNKQGDLVLTKSYAGY